MMSIVDIGGLEMRNTMIKCLPVVEAALVSVALVVAALALPALIVLAVL